MNKEWRKTIYTRRNLRNNFYKNLNKENKNNYKIKQKMYVP